MTHERDRAPGSSGTALILNIVIPIVLLVAFVLAIPGTGVKLGGKYSEPFEVEGTVTQNTAIYFTVDSPRGELIIPRGKFKRFATGTHVTLRLREYYTVTTTDSGSVRKFDSYHYLSVEAR